MPEEEFYLSSARMGSILGVSYRTVQRYREEGYVSDSKEGFPLIESVKHYIKLLKENIEKLQKQLDQKNDVVAPIKLVELKVQKLEAEVRERNAIADIKELERDKLRSRPETTSDFW